MLRLYAPVAREGPSRIGDDGKAITGSVRADFKVNERQDEHPLGHMISGSIGGMEYACSDAPQTEPETGQRAGLLDRNMGAIVCHGPGSTPPATTISGLAEIFSIGILPTNTGRARDR